MRSKSTFFIMMMSSHLNVYQDNDTILCVVVCQEAYNVFCNKTFETIKNALCLVRLQQIRILPAVISESTLVLFEPRFILFFFI
jgi:uncharacterized membrane protein